MEIKVDLTNIKDGLDPGIYDAKVEKIEEKTSKAGNPMLNITLSVVDTNFKLFDNLSLQPQALFKLRDFVVAADIEFSANGFDTLALIGRNLRVRVEQETYEGKTRSKIAEYLRATS